MFSRRTSESLRYRRHDGQHPRRRRRIDLGALPAAPEQLAFPRPTPFAVQARCGCNLERERAHHGPGGALTCELLYQCNALSHSDLVVLSRLVSRPVPVHSTASKRGRLAPSSDALVALWVVRILTPCCCMSLHAPCTPRNARTSTFLKHYAGADQRVLLHRRKRTAAPVERGRPRSSAKQLCEAPSPCPRHGMMVIKPVRERPQRDYTKEMSQAVEATV